jgi:RNAse III (EC 3.1.26.3)
VFTVNCSLQDQALQIEQSAKSIKRAEQLCAQILLDKLTSL